ncbi:NADP-dependent oxidoreductase domain protein [Solidesulfovibrio carbinoliphilus subsp. oakridgensis]|uniref:NADP-dependent oxidoreductase domain protein n=1 Tax=Solidesulfovibrio carbinoliphilus subsp. oakridgensis TaxID=694327 RepID=G7QBP2_9BACT|nr:aldo/keto reductase [Solidesulfovibrio carbinoliphilus]EHJ48905.1 NADP-dependent oxidoreductase domain protein [Solidesulfovibrio carbinoliphilus subsp. oakridgensis]
MLYRTMPKNGDKLSILGFGCMRLPMAEGKIDEARAVAQIRDAIDKGVNYMDTAWPYHAGESEPLLGRALQDGYRQRVRVATKLPSWMIESREDMDTYLNVQLERLKTDHIDYYLVHALDGELWDSVAAHGVREFLDTAKQDGRIVNAGFSFHGWLPDFKRIVDAYAWDFCQIQYNFLDQEFQAGTEGLQYAAEKGLGVVVMEPLRGGSLALPEAPPAVAALWAEADTPRVPVEWALRWVWNHPEVTVVLSGMNEEAHIAQNMAIADVATAGSLSPKDLELVDRAGRTYKELMQVGCTGCGYCMPCPAGVQIPKCFDVYNKLHMFGDAEGAKFMYAVSVSGVLGASAPGFASLCVACGQCLEKCPQHIGIPDMLEKVAAELEDDGLEARQAAALRMFQVRPDGARQGA